MTFTKASLAFKKWFKISRLVPIMTIIGAVAAIVLSLLGILKLSTADNIILALLALLATDALTERLNILEKIEKKLNNSSAGVRIKSRAEIMPVDELAMSASEICIVAVSAISIKDHYFNFFRNKIIDGCSIKIVLLNYNKKPSLDTWNLQNESQAAKADIQASLESLKDLVKIKNAKGKCEVRLTDVFLPFSMVAADMNKLSGIMNVEFHIYQKRFTERPHIVIKASDNPVWFNLYKEQFETAWDKASVWNPK